MINKKFITNMVISFIIIVVALINLFIFRNFDSNKTKAAETNYSTEYKPIFTRDSMGRGSPGTGGNSYTVNYHAVKEQAYEVTIRDSTGEVIAQEYWFSPEFYTQLVTSSGAERECDELAVHFDGSGNFVKSDGTIFDASSFENANFDDLSGILAGLYRQYNGAMVRPGWGCNLPFVIREDADEMTDWPNPCNAPIWECNSWGQAQASLNWLIIYGSLWQKQWFIRGKMY